MAVKAHRFFNAPSFTMKAIRHFAGILLGAVGLLFFLGSLDMIFGSQQEVAWWIGVCVLVAAGVVPLAISGALLKPSVLTLRQPKCPSCESSDHAPAGLLVKRTSFWARHLGGWLLASLWGASREQQVRCTRCDTLYFTQTRGSRIAGAVFWIVVLMILFAQGLEMVMESERAAGHLPAESRSRGR